MATKVTRGLNIGIYDEPEKIEAYYTEIEEARKAEGKRSRSEFFHWLFEEYKRLKKAK